MFSKKKGRDLAQRCNELAAHFLLVELRRRNMRLYTFVGQFL